MIPYIEDRNGIKYEFTKRNRSLLVKMQNKLERLQDDKLSSEDKIATIENIVYELLNYQYNVSKEEYDDILDYNFEEYGLAGLNELLVYIIEDVFTQVDGENTKTNPYLQAKREAAKRKETQQAE